MNQEIVSISEWTQKSECLLQKVKDVLEQVGYKESSLPTSVFDIEKPISIVFVGQFSAGKSTIIKALTGIEDIEIGEGIKTMETHSYDWNGIDAFRLYENDATRRIKSATRRNEEKNERI